jgi:hypothetical protein
VFPVGSQHRRKGWRDHHQKSETDAGMTVLLC